MEHLPYGAMLVPDKFECSTFVDIAVNVLAVLTSYLWSENCYVKLRVEKKTYEVNICKNL